MGFRIEKDSMGEVKVVEDALYAAQTQRALNNFTISDLKMPLAFIDSVLDIKLIAAETNLELRLLSKNKFQAITKAIKKIRKDNLINHKNFPLDVFQTGSGTSTNMNVNEVVAHLASNSKLKVHPNDDVNMGQSSNDVIPTAISVSATKALVHDLIPALLTLKSTIENKGNLHKKVIKTGRTHLMDAMPLSLQQELSGWAHQIQISIDACQKIVPTIAQLAQGGTAIGTGINSSAKFRGLFAQKLKTHSGLPFSKSKNTFASISGQDSSVALSGVLNTLATALMKISNDLRWMNSGPVSGLGEIRLKAIQPGSSIMPGKVNPVVPEAVAMAAAQIMGNNMTITIGAQSGNFQLNVMLPMIAYNLLQSLHLATTSAQHLSETIAHFEVNKKALADKLDQNAILVTSLAPEIGYENASKIVYKARKEERTILDVAKELTDLPEAKLKKLLSPKNLI